MNNNEIIARWLGWFKVANDGQGDYWQEREQGETESPDALDDITWYKLPDFATNIVAQECIKAHFDRRDASIKLIRRARRVQCWRLVVGLYGLPGFDQQSYDEGKLWAKAALFFASLGDD